MFDRVFVFRYQSVAKSDFTAGRFGCIWSEYIPRMGPCAGIEAIGDIGDSEEPSDIDR